MHSKINVNCQNTLGNTPLHDAIFQDRGDIFNLLAQHTNVNPCIKNSMGHSAIDLLHQNQAFYYQPSCQDLIQAQLKQMGPLQ